MKMSAMVDITGYTIMSGSYARLKAMKVRFIVKRLSSKPKAIVAITTRITFRKSDVDNPQKIEPKNREKAPMTELITNVKAIADPTNLEKLLVLLKNFGCMVPKCNAVSKRLLNSPCITPFAPRIAG